MASDRAEPEGSRVHEGPSASAATLPALTRDRAAAWPDAPATLPALLGAAAARIPDAPAIAAADGSVTTYAGLLADADAFRADLRRLGVGRDDRVAVALPEGPVAARLAIALACAAVVTPLAPDLPAAEASALLHRLRPATLVLPPGTFPNARTAAAEAGVAVLEAAPGAAGTLRLAGRPVGPAAADAPADPDGLAAIQPTSGSTGRSKLVMVRHRSLAGVAAVGRRFGGLRPGDRAITTSPLASPTGIANLARLVGLGGATIAPDRLRPDHLADLMARHDPSWLAVSPAMLAALLPVVAARPELPGPGLRFLCCGGSALTGEVLAAAERQLGVPVWNVVGSSEAQGLAVEGPDQPRRPGTAGVVVCEMRVVGDDGTPLPEGEAGELQVRGDNVTPGYWDDPELTAATRTADGWFRTGDRGLVRDGYLTLLGRADAMVNRGGQKVDPLEVELVLAGHPAVAEAAVFGVPAPRLGLEVAAAVVLRPDAAVTERELRRWLLDRLAPHKVPRLVRFVDALPRTPAGKVARAELAETFGPPAAGPG